MECGTPSPTPVYVGRAVRRVQTPVSVSGRILDFSTDAGVPGATVVFIGADEVVGLGTQVRAVSDAAGFYRVTVAEPGVYYPRVDGNGMGLFRVTGVGDRGDLFVHAGTCVRRYGIVLDSRTLCPIARAKVSLEVATS